MIGLGLWSVELSFGVYVVPWMATASYFVTLVAFGILDYWRGLRQQRA